MCHFMFWADIEGPRWVLMGLVVKLAHSVRRFSFLSYYRLTRIADRTTCASLAEAVDET
jgi:hypothetical protein